MVDLILLVIVLLALLWGWFSGSVRLLAGLGALFVAYQVARYSSLFWAAPVANMLTQQEGQSKLMDLATMFVDADVLTTRVVQVVLFVIIFILTRWLINKMASLTTNLFGGSIVGTINRVFGALLGGAVVSLLVFFIHTVALTFIGESGLDLAFTAQDILQQSKFVLPLMYNVPHLFGL